MFRAPGAQADIERIRRPPGGIMQKPDAVVLSRQIANHVWRAVCRPAVDDQELQLTVEALGAHRRNRLLDIAARVQGRHQHRHVDAVWLASDTDSGALPRRSSDTSGCATADLSLVLIHRGLFAPPVVSATARAGQGARRRSRARRTASRARVTGRLALEVLSAKRAVPSLRYRSTRGKPKTSRGPGSPRSANAME